MSKKRNLLSQLIGKDIIIWGARMTGLGAVRFLKDNELEPTCFLDSDPAFINMKVANLNVYKPNEIIEQISKNKWNPVILIAVALKESEIINSLKSNKLDNIEYLSFQSDDAPYFTVDILGSCQLKCASCPHSIEDHSVPGGSMDFETVKKVIDKIKVESPDTTHISLYSWGEPLLHPRVSEIVDYVHKKGIAVALSSNLSLTFDQRIEKLIKSSPEYLKISVSGFYPKAYNATHQGGDINLVKSNLYRIKYFIDKYKSTTMIDINYHLYRDNNGKNLRMFQELAKELGFILSSTYALVMPLERVLNYTNGKPDLQTNLLEHNLLVNIDEGIKISADGVSKLDTCAFRENQVNINSDLTVPVCCTVFEREDNIVSQNYLESSLEEIEKNKKSVVTCKKCMERRLPEYNMGFNKKLWQETAQKKSSTDLV